MIMRFLTLLKQVRKNYIMKRSATLLGKNYIFGLKSGIGLYKSDKSNIILGDNVKIYGNLISQNHGKIIFKDYVRLASSSQITSVEYIEIGSYTTISNNTIITDNNNHPVNPLFRRYRMMQPDGDDSARWIHSAHAPVIIGENCWIGRNVSIMKGVTIGANSVVAANSVVTKSIPANCIAAGNPAKIVKTDIQNIPAPTSCEGFNNYIKTLQNK